MLKELHAEWLVEVVEYIADNPSFIVNGFFCSGILRALSRKEDDEESEDYDNGVSQTDSDEDSDDIVTDDQDSCDSD